MEKYKSVSTEKIGRLKGHKVHLHIDKSVRPVQQPYRRIPYHLVKAADEELDELQRNGVLEVPPGPVTWKSQWMVVANPKKPGKVHNRL